MSEIDRKALDVVFTLWRNERMPTEDEADAFERFANEQVLKNPDLSDDEIESGKLGAGDDGGVDGFFFFVGDTLMQEGKPPPESATTAELILIQTTRTAGFAEAKLLKLKAFCEDVFGWTSLDGKAHLNATSKSAILRFREQYTEIMASVRALKVSIHYVTKSPHQFPSNLLGRVNEIKNYITNQVSSSVVEFTPWGCGKLLEAARDEAIETLILEKSVHFATDDGSVVCLVRLDKFKEFLTGKDGKIRTAVLEPNVRDYQGRTNPVNKEIRNTLSSPAVEEFWWLNNGVTILSDECPVLGNKVKITNPEIVNGLQTSHEIFNALASANAKNPERLLLVRVIKAPDDRIRNSIIKATNSQTPVSRVSLRATERIHFDIEDRLAMEDIFYDRRKGKYKRLRRPISKIVSITSVGQAVIAALLQLPADARARPGTLLNDDERYGNIFNESFGTEFFTACVLLDRQVSNRISQLEISRDVRVDVRYYVTMLVACEMAGTAKPTAVSIAGALPKIKEGIPEEMIDRWTNKVIEHYYDLGGTDKVAKGTELQEEMIKAAILHFL
ncbi:MAG TPA: AIPR family protein [Chthoniobacterales bacterium]|nr:AIPR family protein [Chthoniobacterales bacterium]